MSRLHDAASAAAAMLAKTARYASAEIRDWLLAADEHGATLSQSVAFVDEVGRYNIRLMDGLKALQSFPPAVNLACIADALPKEDAMTDIEAPEPLPEDDRPPLVRNDSAAWVWVERHLKRELSEPHRRAVQVVCSGVAPYNLRANWKKAEWFEWGALAIVIGGELATFDFDRLTQMVIAAHDHCMRLSVEGVGPGYLRVVVHPRETRRGGIMVRHPTIREAVKRHSRALLPEVPDAD